MYIGNLENNCVRPQAAKLAPFVECRTCNRKLLGWNAAPRRMFSQISEVQSALGSLILNCFPRTRLCHYRRCLVLRYYVETVIQKPTFTKVTYVFFQSIICCIYNSICAHDATCPRMEGNYREACIVAHGPVHTECRTTQFSLASHTSIPTL